MQRVELGEGVMVSSLSEGQNLGLGDVLFESIRRDGRGGRGQGKQLRFPGQ